MRTQITLALVTAFAAGQTGTQATCDQYLTNLKTIGWSCNSAGTCTNSNSDLNSTASLVGKGGIGWDAVCKTAEGTYLTPAGSSENGATTMTTYGVAIVAAIAALAF